MLFPSRFLHLGVSLAGGLVDGVDESVALGLHVALQLGHARRQAGPLRRELLLRLRARRLHGALPVAGVARVWGKNRGGVKRNMSRGGRE